MRKWAAVFLLFAAVVLFYVACADSPTSPGSTGLTTTTGPFGPSTGPFGPSTGPFGPSTGPFGPNGGGGGGGGGGGTATPTPTGVPGGPPPTPTSTPTLPCPSSLTFETTMPQLLQNLTIPIPTGNYGNECVVAKAIVSLYAKTTGGGDINSNGEVFASLDACGAGPGFSGCGGAVIYRLNFAQPSGSLLGTACYDTIFDDSSPVPFDPPVNSPPPYSGFWQWPETKLQEWYLKSQFQFSNLGGPSDYELQCLKVVFVTKTVPVP